MTASHTLIAVIDTDIWFLQMMVEVLEDAGYKALSLYEDDLVVEILQHYKPRLAIIDISIVEPDRGWNLLTALRQAPDTATMPILVTSTLSSLLEQNMPYLWSQGCGTLIKPFDINTLIEKIGHFVPPTSGIDTLSWASANTVCTE